MLPSAWRRSELVECVRSAAADVLSLHVDAVALGTPLVELKGFDSHAVVRLAAALSQKLRCDTAPIAFLRLVMRS